ncbi:hypothetical protein CSE16_11825 [Solibacillus sp. R5-41]|uniref:hypothetical protein n=1 Tax=Solibacillus sp. R5-41 TaxID=2048654 RepID=UPI000C127A16|nr:hypothetical protein [Solibacillus sp. R5-41]ATP40680.1 hypothetical protein CSE16_11825 [Solibacillus sp. R5-41]
MYALSNSFLKPTGEYHVETYCMELLSYAAFVSIELKIFGGGFYTAGYEIEREDGKTTEGTCMNRPTKEDTLLAVEEAVIRAMEDENRYWK